MGLGGAGLDAELLEELLAHDVRRAAHGLGHAQVHAGFAKVDGRELRVAVGEVQKAHIAELGHAVEALTCAGCCGEHVAVVEGHSGGARHGQHLHEFTAAETHLCTYQ
ncbi:hypothetical protein FQZ97_831500 [compost metagenome]